MEFDTYRIGIMKAPVEETDPAFSSLVDTAASKVEAYFQEHLPEIDIEVFEVSKFSLFPSAGAYSALDFLEIGLRENGLRNFHFLIIITEVNLIPQNMPYTLGLPSQITNTGVLTTRCLDQQGTALTLATPEDHKMVRSIERSMGVDREKRSPKIAADANKRKYAYIRALNNSE